MSALTLSAVAMAFLALIMERYPNEKPPVETIDATQVSDSYDFIIVGAGSAGSTLANRLTEIGEWKVLLVEAGHQETIFSRTPLMWAALIGSSFDWNYTTTEQKMACRAKGGKCTYPRGRVLGGSSGTNAMIYARGYKSDYDRWGVDNCGWSFKDVEPYFLQAEGNRIPSAVNHGRQGPLTVSYAPYKAAVVDQIIKAGIAKGLKNTDCPEYEGGCIFHVMSTIRDGRRCSASTAYLEPIKRPNLHVLTGAQVSQVIISNNRAQGVKFVVSGETKTVLSTKEVILSAGAVNSPQILMLSGVGLKNHLAELGIPLKADLPVGNNLQDHNIVPLFFNVANGTVPTLEDIADRQTQEQYLNNQTGPYSYSGADVLGWVRVGNGNKLPNVQYHIVTLPLISGAYLVRPSTTTIRPETRGTVRLSSTNPSDPPLIDTNYYGVQSDKQTTLDGMRFIVDLFSTFSTLAREQSPLCESILDPTDFLTCVIREYTGTVYHPVGTAKMADKTKNGVVNFKLQVHGIKNLRVIDASIAPTIISMNTNAMSIMIGEKGADMIKAAYGKPTRQKIPFCSMVDNILSKFM